MMLPGAGSDAPTTVVFYGNRVPPLPPRPDLTRTVFGEPRRLFNGRDLDGWTLTNKNQINGWRAIDGELVNTTPKRDFQPYSRYGNLRTAAEFKDFNLQIEFNVPVGANSGIYLRGTYEAQVVDRDSRMQGIQGVGAIFGRIAPSENAGLPGGSWQHDDLTLVDRHATVVWNGKKVIDNQPIAGCTNGALSADETQPGPIYLQGDHTAVRYRNIVLRPVDSMWHGAQGSPSGHRSTRGWIRTSSTTVCLFARPNRDRSRCRRRAGQGGLGPLGEAGIAWRSRRFSRIPDRFGRRSGGWLLPVLCNAPTAQRRFPVGGPVLGERPMVGARIPDGVAVQWSFLSVLQSNDGRFCGGQEAGELARHGCVSEVKRTGSRVDSMIEQTKSRRRPVVEYLFLTAALIALGGASVGMSGEPPRPLRVLLITGGCCHDYKVQKDLLKEGLEARAHVTVDQVHSDDASTAPKLAIFGNPDYAKGYDVVIHDECAAKISDPAVIAGVLAPHRAGIPGVNLHCAMHCYRIGSPADPADMGAERAMWFEYLGLQSSGHGPKLPIPVETIDADHPITRGLGWESWTTGEEELYNNIQIYPTATPLQRGSQVVRRRGTEQRAEAVVTWVNEYRGTRVFSTTLGHYNQTVGDDRYLDLVTRGLLWACGKLDAGYLKPETEGVD